ncbi:MAG TPA: hypothetical protein VL486_08500 [Verrucomicrobiae bacterium]|nr:hypothetical protein [Verrucomicrobiae bacterium]
MTGNLAITAWISNFLQEHWFLIIAVVLLLAFVISWKKSPRFKHFFRKLLVRFETRDFRPWAEQRDWFLKLTLIFLLAGIAGAVCKSELLKPHLGDWYSHLAGIVFDVSGLLIAVLGFSFAVYGIRGVLERPRDLGEILVRSSQLLDRYAKDGSTAVILCEYPAWGALSLETTPAYEDFMNAFDRFLKPAGLKTKLILVAPDDNEMENRIRHYAMDYDRTAPQVLRAKESNNCLLTRFSSYASSGRFARHQHDTNDVPRYQALLVGKEIRDDNEPNGVDFLPVEAIIWYAPRNSDVTTGLAATAHAEKRQKWVWTEKDVPVLAWQTTAPYVLRELYDCARFYANRDRRLTYREFLEPSKPPPKS